MMFSDQERVHESGELLERGAEVLGSVPPEVVQRVVEKFSRMSETLTEIEDWLDAGEARWLAAVAPEAPGRAPPLTYKSLDLAILREQAR